MSCKITSAKVYKVIEEEGAGDVEYVEKMRKKLIKKHEIKAGFICGSKRLSK